jgi:hypothetical protein
VESGWVSDGDLAVTVALVTCRMFPDGTADDALLQAEFSRQSVRAVTVPWNDATVDWRRFDHALLRSCWDYHYDWRAFSAWVERTAHETNLVNHARLVQWNMHKSYLLEFADMGFSVVPTTVLPVGQHYPISQISEYFGTRELVIKPAVSASAYRTSVISSQHIPFESAQGILNELVAERDALVQPFLREIVCPGERSLIFFGGHFSHAVSRPPLSRGAAGGEGRERSILVSKEQVQFGERIIAALTSVPCYARVDMLPLVDGTLALMELELIEPALYLSLCDGSAAHFATTFLDRIAHNER